MSNPTYVVGLASHTDADASIACVLLDARSRQIITRTSFTSSARLPTGSTTNSSTQQGPVSVQELVNAISTCCTSANINPAALAAVCISMVELPPATAAMQTSIQQQLGGAAKVLIMGSAVAALAAGTGGTLQGCVLVAGAGILAFGISADSSSAAGHHGLPAASSSAQRGSSGASGGVRTAVSGGWGPAFMDGGSGWDLGSRALAAVAKAADGRGAATLLSEAILHQLGFNDMRQLIQWVYSSSSRTISAATGGEGGSGAVAAAAPGPQLGSGVVEASMSAVAASAATTAATVASLGPLVVDCATVGDAVSDAILRHGVGELVRAVRAVAVRVGLERSMAPPTTPAGASSSVMAAVGPVWRVVLAGPLLAGGSLYTSMVAESLKEACPQAEAVHPTVEPAQAAAWLAALSLTPQGATAVTAAARAAVAPAAAAMPAATSAAQGGVGGGSNINPNIRHQ